MINDMFQKLENKAVIEENLDIRLIADFLNSDYGDYSSFEPIKRFFPLNVFDFHAEVGDYEILSQLRDSLASDSLRIYIEILVCKCKGHFTDSYFPKLFEKYARECFENANSSQDFLKDDFELFLMVSSNLFNNVYNLIFDDFLMSITSTISIPQLFICICFLNLFNYLNTSGKLNLLKKLDIEFSFSKNDIGFINVSIEIINIILKLPIDNNTKRRFKYLYAKVIDSLLIDNPHYEPLFMIDYYYTAFNYLAEIESDDMVLVDSLEKKRAYAKNSASSTMTAIDIPLDKKHANEIQSELDKLLTVMRKEGFPKNLFHLFTLLDPFCVSDIRKRIDETKANSITSFFETKYFDDEGELVNYRELTDDERFSVEAHESISIVSQILHHNLINCFSMANHNVDQNNVTQFFRSFVNDFPYIEPECRDEIIEVFTNIVIGKFYLTFRDLCSNLESSLRFFFSCKDINTRKMKPHRNDVIDLNDIFDYSKSNRYATELLKIIDEDFYFTLTWMLTDKFGWNLRNKVIHGVVSGEKKKTLSYLLASMQILKFYFSLNNS